MNKLVYILKKYNVEPVLFLYAFGRNLYFPTLVNQLLTDKLCYYEYNHNATFCEHLTSDEFKNTDEAKEVITSSVNLMTYGQWTLSIPSIIAAILLGPWLDAHAIAPKIVLLTTVSCALVEACIMMLNVIFFTASAPWVLTAYILHGLSGSIMMGMTAVFAFAMKETPLAERTFRFTVIEFFLVVTGPMSSYVSGLMLPLGPWLFEDQTRNYAAIFGLSIISYLICLTHISLVLGEVKEVRSAEDSALKRASVRTSLQPMSTDFLSVDAFNNEAQYVNNGYRTDETDEKDFKLNLDANGNQIGVPDRNLTTSGPELQKPRSLSFQEPLPVLSKKNQESLLKSLFRFGNAVAMFKGIVKRREAKAHILLWQIIAIYLLVGICINGTSPIQLAFVHDAYIVDGEPIETSYYLKIDSYGSLGLGLTSTFVLAFFHKIELRDTIIIISGLVSLFFYLFLQGVILSVTGFILSYVFGCIFICAIVACRGMVSKIIPENEIGTILGALSVLYAASPVIGSFFYSRIYNATRSFYYGTAYLSGSFLIAIAFCVSIWLFVRFNRFSAKMPQKSDNSAKA